MTLNLGTDAAIFAVSLAAGALGALAGVGGGIIVVPVLTIGSSAGADPSSERSRRRPPPLTSRMPCPASSRCDRSPSLRRGCSSSSRRRSSGWSPPAILQAVGQSAFMVLLTEHDLIIRRALVAAHGREVKHTGDGIMASFDDVASALECSLTIQAGFEARAAEGLTPDLRVRIGIAAGEPVDHNDDLFGSTVTLASRICDAADAGRILTSDLVRALGSERGFAFDGGRDLVLKGFSGPTRVFELASRRS